MCIICVKNSKKQLTKEQLKNCWDNNPDGAGIIWLENKIFHFQKGFESFKDFRKKWYEVSKDSKISAFHCRIATHGGISPELTHPFYIDRDKIELSGSGELAMHNGVLSEKVYSSYFTKNDSDTSAYCKKIYIETLSKKDIENDTAGSRFVIFKNGVFRLFGKWIYDNGLFFSNDTYSYKKQNYNYFGSSNHYGKKHSFYPVDWYGIVVDSNGIEVKNTKNLYSDDGFSIYEYYNGAYKLKKNLFIEDSYVDNSLYR